jgi:hypothetical protein
MRSTAAFHLEVGERDAERQKERLASKKKWL